MPYQHCLGLLRNHPATFFPRYTIPPYLYVAESIRITMQISLSENFCNDAITGSVIFSQTWVHYVRVPSVVCNVRAPYSGVGTFGNISLPFCSWHSCKILQRSFQGNPSAWGIKHKKGIATCVTLGYRLLMSFSSTHNASYTVCQPGFTQTLSDAHIGPQTS